MKQLRLAHSNAVSTAMGSKKNGRKKAIQKEIKICSQSDKEECINKIISLKQSGLKIGKHLFAGFNEIMKKVERHEISVVCTFKDCPQNLLVLIRQTCCSNGIPLLTFPKASNFPASLGVKRISAFGLINQSLTDSQSEYHILDAKIDDLRDFLLSLNI